MICKELIEGLDEGLKYFKDVTRRWDDLYPFKRAMAYQQLLTMFEETAELLKKIIGDLTK